MTHNAISSALWFYSYNFSIFFISDIVVTLYACFYYQTLVVEIIQLELALVIAEMTALVAGVNNQLDRSLQSISQNCKSICFGLQTDEYA